jgi:hypothetical protein
MQQLYINMCQARDNMEKLAQSKWRALIDAAPDQQALSNLFAEFNRNHYVNGWTNQARAINLHQPQDINELRTKIKQILNVTKPKPWANKPVHALTPDEFATRKEISFDKQDERKRRGKTSMSIDTGHDPEEWMPIIHGTNRARAEAFLRSGNGAARTDSVHATGIAPPSHMGIMVHSKFGDRADDYAGRAAASRGGDPVVLTGEIQRKHLFPNPSRGSGYGDEYSIPVPFHDKIRNATLRPGTTKATEFM